MKGKICKAKHIQRITLAHSKLKWWCSNILKKRKYKQYNYMQNIYIKNILINEKGNKIQLYCKV